jgi:hypothetical protein
VFTLIDIKNLLVHGLKSSVEIIIHYLKKNCMTYVKFNPKSFEQGFNSLIDGFVSEWPANFKKDFKQSLWKDLAPVNVKEKDGNYLLEVIAPWI